MYGEKIRMIRELRNYSQEYVAEQLGIKQNSYSKIERNETKLTAEMLQKISTLFGVSPIDIISSQPAIVNFQPNQGTQQSFGYIETFVASQKEIYDKMIAGKDAEIDRLTKQVEELMKLVGKKS
jgi:transcriptional regulator with XRE-family HTH domain